MSGIKDSLGLENVGIIKRNLDVDSLMKDAVEKEGAKISSTGALMIDTGIFTGRSPKDKFFVNQDPSNKYIAWGDINHKVSKEVYEDLLKNSKKQLSNKDIYVTDVYCGASLDSRKSVRFITEVAWQAHFIQNMFIVPKTQEELLQITSDNSLHHILQLSYQFCSVSDCFSFDRCKPKTVKLQRYVYDYLNTNHKDKFIQLLNDSDYVIIPGNGSRNGVEFIVFKSPTCPYCMELEEFLSKTNTTTYEYMSPSLESMEVFKKYVDNPRELLEKQAKTVNELKLEIESVPLTLVVKDGKVIEVVKGADTLKFRKYL